MDLLHLVDRLEELVGSAQKMPIGSRAIVDRRRILDIVDQMRVAVPQEVRDAQAMVTQRDEVYREAEEEARLIIARAEERAARMVEQHELTIAARARAEEIAQQAEARLEERIAEANAEIQQRILDSRHVADQQMDGADEYARQLLSRLETQLQAFVRSVQSGIQQLQTPAHPSEAGAEGAATAAGGWAAEQATDSEAGGFDEYSMEEPATEDIDGLENLLPERDHTGDNIEDTPPEPSEPGVIDDFSMPQYDDDQASAVAGAGDEQPEDDDASRRLRP
jgi:hypothetical protein